MRLVTRGLGAGGPLVTRGLRPAAPRAAPRRPDPRRGTSTRPGPDPSKGTSAA